jgi:hypothetical protein
MGITRDLGIKVHHLHQCVHSGIGPSGAQSRDPLPSELAQCCFEPVLDRETRSLTLPALVRLAAVADS